MRMLNLLLVEDNTEHMNWLLGILKKRGAAIPCQVKFQTGDWNRALEFLHSKKEEIDIAITDLQDEKTRGFIGFQVIREAKKLGIPVIAVSSRYNLKIA